MTLQEHFLKAFLAQLPIWEESHWRKLKLDALRQRRAWRKADIAKLRAIGMSTYAEKRLLRLAAGNRLGRPSVKAPKTLDDVANEILRGLRLWANPDTPGHQRREFYKSTRWFPEFVEAAYRGELIECRKAERRPAKSDRGLPHLCPSEQAESNVAKAAGISCALVRKHCNQVRKDYGSQERRNPATTAEDLKRHLEKGRADQIPGGPEILRRFFRS